MQFVFFGPDLPLFQVWRPALPNSSVYNKIGEVELPSGDHIGGIIINYYFVNQSLNNSAQIEFQSGDIIGYYQSSSSQRLIRNIQTSGYTSYSNTVSSPLTLIDINNVENSDTDRQPLIEVTFGKFIATNQIVHAHKIQYLYVLYVSVYSDKL